MHETGRAFSRNRTWHGSKRLRTVPGLLEELALGLSLALALTSPPAVFSQSQGPPPGVGQSAMRPGFPSQQGLDPIAPADYDPVMMERRLRALNMERQKEMVSDTNKLLKLARELNAEVAANKSGALTPDQLRKIAEIEKLARNVRERMITGIGAPQSMMPLPTVTYPSTH